MRTLDLARREQDWWVVVLESDHGGRDHVELFACDAEQAGLKARGMLPGSRVVQVHLRRSESRCPAFVPSFALS